MDYDKLLKDSIDEERRKIMARERRAQQTKESKRYVRDMRIVNGVMIFCAVALVVLLAIQTLR